MFLINSIDGGSTVIQRRVDGSVDFDQTWNKYEQGFGDLESEYFYHSLNHILHRLDFFLNCNTVYTHYLITLKRDTKIHIWLCYMYFNTFIGNSTRYISALN